MELNSDGTMVGKTFSGEYYTGEHPRPQQGDTYESYHLRVKECVSKGFHLGDLSFANYAAYCVGFGRDPEISKDELIF